MRINALFLLVIYQLLKIQITSARNQRNDPPKNPCEGLPHDTFVANPKGCKYMFHCRKGKPFEAFCPQDLWFNPDAGICDLRSNVECHLDDEKPEAPSKELIICPSKDSKDLKYVSSTVECGRYYICYHGKAIRHQCIKDLHWNRIENKCDYPDNAKCSIISNLPECPMIGQVFYPHPKECNYFVFCHNGFATIQQCPFYHHWDASSETCMWRTAARCGSKKNETIL